MMEQNRQDLMKLINNKFQKLSKGQKLIAEYILNHYDKAAYMTAAKLGKTVDVSESTVVRFANELGFSGYPKLQKALQEIVKAKLTSVQRIELSSGYTSEENLLKSVLKSDIENIKTTLEKIDNKTFEDVVNALFSANRIYIVGYRSSQALADFLDFYLGLVLDNVKLISTGVSDVFEQLLRVKEGDVVIGIGFPRYSSTTVEALKFARSKDAKVVAITDSMISPLAENANYTLIAQSNMASFVDSLVAPLSVINALIVAVGIREKQKISETFKTLENIWDEYNIYTYKNQAP